MIHKQKPEDLNRINKGTLMESLGIEYLEAKEGFVKARMPVDHRTLQPMGILHGGASIALAETVGGLGSALLVDPDRYEIRGASLAANHLGAATGGYVFAEARILHQGKMTHVWDIEIKTEDGRKISLSRLTVMIIPKQKKGE
ncbi:MAG: hotdog fold thioesterase [Bacteroidales bacterium]|nr:hotdog fold thioesterase [Bacteroidales bacterium]